MNQSPPPLVNSKLFFTLNPKHNKVQTVLNGHRQGYEQQEVPSLLCQKLGPQWHI